MFVGESLVWISLWFIPLACGGICCTCCEFLRRVPFVLTGGFCWRVLLWVKPGTFLLCCLTVLHQSKNGDVLPNPSNLLLSKILKTDIGCPLFSSGAHTSSSEHVGYDCWKAYRSNAVSEPTEGYSRKVTRSIIQAVERGTLLHGVENLVATSTAYSNSLSRTDGCTGNQGERYVMLKWLFVSTLGNIIVQTLSFTNSRSAFRSCGFSSIS